jgi:multiple sugar transport system permease protein
MTQTVAKGSAARPRRAGSRAERRFAVLCLLPAVALLLLFRIVPLGWGFLLSLRPDGGGPAGLENYAAAAADPTFRQSMANTVLLLATLPVWVMLPMLLAILIHTGVPGGRLFRAVYFLPAVLSSVIVGAIFNVVLRFDGSLNAALAVFGFDAVDWLGSSSTALWSLIAVQLWATFGMSVLIFLAGLSTVPDDIVEAARIDGARFWQRLFLIVIPSLRPIIEFVAVVTTIGVLTSMFGLIYVLTGGGPGASSTLPEFLIWLEQGRLNRPGRASAISVFLFVMMAGVAWAQIRIMTRNARI